IDRDAQGAGRAGDQEVQAVLIAAAGAPEQRELAARVAARAAIRVRADERIRAAAPARVGRVAAEVVAPARPHLARVARRTQWILADPSRRLAARAAPARPRHAERVGAAAVEVARDA